MHKLIVAPKIIVSLLVVIFVFSVSLVFSQTAVPTITPPTPATTTDDIIIGVVEPPEIAATNQALGSNRKIFNYRVAYFIDTRETYDEIVSLETIQRLTGAVIIGSKEDFQKYQQSGQPPIQVALIHGSMVKKIDREWARTAYRDGTVLFGGIDMRSNHLGDVVGDNCIYFPGSETFDRSDHSFFFLTYRLGIPTNVYTADEIEAMHHRQLELCKGAGVSLTKGFTQFPITSEADINALIWQIEENLSWLATGSAVIDPERTAEATIPG